MTEQPNTDLTNPTDTLRQLLNELAEELRESVKTIEAGPYLTKGHYGEYMGFLSATDDVAKRKMMACALMLAGADRDGVADALRLTTGG